MSIQSIRAALLEEVILHLLGKLGYSTIESPSGDPQLRSGGAGLELQGRGGWHQMDALASLDASPPFVYPLRLIVEAKCYRDRSTIGVEVVRNIVGVLKDISENCVSHSLDNFEGQLIQPARFNYVAALFSTSGFTKPAIRYAVAHQVFLIQYKRVHLFKPVIDAIRSLNKQHFKAKMLAGAKSTLRARSCARSIFSGDDDPQSEVLSIRGQELISTIAELLSKIGGSYFGMLQGRWPIHLLSRKPIPECHFETSDTLECRVYGLHGNRWSFVPLIGSDGDPDWFRLEFDLPLEIASMIRDLGDDRVAIAGAKKSHFSYIALTGIIGGVRRQVKLTLNEEWIENYIQRYS
ncbi:MAG: restriction endonuclease [Armatimonadetes bacterium]|nr:restriction endonuclease [Akkermansiaceae bacterium]